MPIVQPPFSPPSRLSDVIQQVHDAFQEMGNATPIMVGKAYLRQFGAGSDARVLFVPYTDGRMGPPIEMGNAASVNASCDVLVRAEPGGGDIDRLVRAEELAELVIGCLAVAASGRIEWGEYGDGSPVDVDDYGAEIAFSFRVRRDVLHAAKRWELPPAGMSTALPLPQPPPGEAGQVNTFDVEEEQVEP